MAEAQKEFDLEALFKRFQERIKKSNEVLRRFNEETRAELAKENNILSKQMREDIERLSTKLTETNARVEGLEAKVQQSLNEQAYKILVLVLL